MLQVNCQGIFSIDQVDQPWQVTGLLWLSELLIDKYKERLIHYLRPDLTQSLVKNESSPCISHMLHSN